MPFRVALAVRKLQNLHGMFVGVLEIESLDACGVFVPIRQALRAGRGVLHFVLAQNLISAVHVADDDGDVLEPHIIATGIRGNRTPFGRKKLQQLDGLAAQLHAHDADSRTKDAEEMLDFVAGQLDVGDFVKGQYAGVKIDGTVHVFDGDDNRADFADLDCRTARGSGGC